MPIATLILEIIPLINLFILLFIVYQAYRLRKAFVIKSQAIENKYQEAIKRIEALEPVVPVAPPSPNEASKKPEKAQVLDENVPWDIPKDVKIAVEGGDTNIPPDYEV